MIGWRRARLAVAALVVTALPACHSWHATDVSPRQYIAERRPETVRLVLADGTNLALEDPEVVGEAIIGVPLSPPDPHSVIVAPAERRAPVRAPLSLVLAAEERRFSSGRTVVAVGAAAAAAVAVLVAVFSNRTHLTGCSPSGC